MPTLILKRRNPLLDTGHEYKVFVNDNLVTTFAKGNTFNLDLSEGEHKIKVTGAWFSSGELVFTISEQKSFLIGLSPRYKITQYAFFVFLFCSIFSKRIDMLKTLHESHVLLVLTVMALAAQIYFLTFGRKQLISITELNK